MYKFGSARISENGTVNGQRGDSTGTEVMIQEAYMHRNGWQIIRAKDVNVANALAWIMKVACMSDEVGYSQQADGGRYYIFFTGIRNGVPTNCDCSSLVAYCVQQCGITDFVVDGFYTGNEVSRLVGTGAFDVLPCNSIEEMCTGDILVDAKGTSHTGIIVEGNYRGCGGDVFDDPLPVLQYGDRGTEVRKLQQFFEEYGSGCGIDSVYGFETWSKVYQFQELFHINADGIYGEQTHQLLMAFLFLKGVSVV